MANEIVTFRSNYIVNAIGHRINGSVMQCFVRLRLPTETGKYGHNVKQNKTKQKTILRSK